MSSKEQLTKFCVCETIFKVARDGYSTCLQCGGIDAYKKSPFRKSSQAPEPTPTPTQQLSRIVELCEKLNQEDWIDGYTLDSSQLEAELCFSHDCPRFESIVAYGSTVFTLDKKNAPELEGVILKLETALDKGSFE